MGELSSWPINDIRTKFDLHSFVETGTWKGDGLAAAMRSAFSWCWSIEVNTNFWSKATERISAEFPERHNWSILLGESEQCIKWLLGQELYGPTLWWLDAHLPDRYDKNSEAERMPLEYEVRAIVDCNTYDHTGDVFLLDDWRLYEPGMYQSGNLPQEAGPPGDPRLILEALRPTHTVMRDYREEGYLVATPRRG